MSGPRQHEGGGAKVTTCAGHLTFLHKHFLGKKHSACSSLEQDNTPKEKWKLSSGCHSRRETSYILLFDSMR